MSERDKKKYKNLFKDDSLYTFFIRRFKQKKILINLSFSSLKKSTAAFFWEWKNKIVKINKLPKPLVYLLKISLLVWALPTSYSIIIAFFVTRIFTTIINVKKLHVKSQLEIVARIQSIEWFLYNKIFNKNDCRV